MKLIIKTIIFNIVAICAILLVIELSIWQYENKKLKKMDPNFSQRPNIPFHPGIGDFPLDPKYFPNIERNYGRLPEGLQYKTKPIVIFGCSYAYGYLLENEQTFSYKLSKLAKRPVYNRAFTGWGAQQMLKQTSYAHFFDLIPEPEYAIYVFIDDQIRRPYLLSFCASNFLNETINLRYKEENGTLVEIENKNPFLRFIRRLYITNELNQLYVQYFIVNKKDKIDQYDFTYKHILQSKKNMENHWKNTKFVVLMYHPQRQRETEFMKKKLEKQNFIVIKTQDLTTENLLSPPYFPPNLHPTEAAWDLITPLLIERLKLNEEVL